MLDHRREERQAARELGPRAVVEMDHRRQARLGAGGDGLPPVGQRAQVAGMAVGDVVADRGAVAVGLDAARHGLGVGGSVGVAEAVGLEDLQLGAEGVAGILAPAAHDQHVSRGLLRAQHELLQLIEALHTREVAALREQGELPLLLALGRVGRFGRDAEQAGVDAGLQLQPGADDTGDGGGDRAGAERRVALVVACAAAQVGQVGQRVGIGRARLGPPVARGAAILAAALPGAGGRGQQRAVARALQPGARVEVADDAVDQVGRGKGRAARSFLHSGTT